ncbi:DUF456 domain-containing protein [Plantactinospora sp. KBS50]|uniref:DUF456 domain-containing protein n=1 Tax=Plantactinospora sp. KBS50 TaxID=2024580 RepID=UPI000BAB0F69|nr:DUF456 domain-containing protein [Plantactinospora sp. KBS50]ASW54055.1 hypothetical protein CIK06_07430 [Plantactinospora sp. KBS50]
MDLTDTNGLVTLIAGLAIVLGLVSMVLPGLPALPVCWAGVLVWAIFSDAGPGRWLVLAVATVLALGGTVVKYLLPGRNLKRSGVPTLSLFWGAVLGIVGFFVIPVVGLIIGFIAGVFLAELVRLGDVGRAWPSTWYAVKATGLAVMIELCAGLAIAAVWMLGLFVA